MSCKSVSVVALNKALQGALGFKFMTVLSARKVLKFGALLLVTAVAMQFLISRIMANDAATPGAEGFVRSSTRVAQEFGEIKSFSVMKLIRYQGTPGKEAPYRDFTFRVAGEKANGIVVVRAEQNMGNNYSYRLIQIKK